MSAVARCCETCVSWWRGASPIATQIYNPIGRVDRGACHFGPPTPTHLAPGRVESLFPETAAEAVCGRWRARETDGPIVVPIRGEAA